MSNYDISSVLVRLMIPARPELAFSYRHIATSINSSRAPPYDSPWYLQLVTGSERGKAGYRKLKIQGKSKIN